MDKPKFDLPGGKPEEGKKDFYDTLKDASIGWDQFENAVYAAMDAHKMSVMEGAQVLQIAYRAKKASNPFVSTQLRAVGERNLLTLVGMGEGSSAYGSLRDWVRKGGAPETYISVAQTTGLERVLTKLGIDSEDQRYFGLGR